MSPLQKSLEEAFPENYGIFLYYDRDEYQGGLNPTDYYKELVKNASRYISVRGMFEVKEGYEYRV